MNPITITFSPFLYTDWGFKNLRNWINAGFENYLNTPNQLVYRLLARISLEKMLHPWHPWILGQKNYPTKFAQKFKRIAIEGRDISSKILNKNPRYDIAFFFKCNLTIAAKRRWKDLNWR